MSPYPPGAPGRLQRLAEAFRAQLLAGEAQAAARMVRIWRSAYVQAAHELGRAAEQAPGQQTFWTQRVEALRYQIAQEFDKAARLSGDIATRRQAQAYRLGVQHAERMFEQGLNVTFAKLPADAVEQWIAFAQSEQSPVRQALARLAGREVEQAMELVAQAQAFGWNPEQTALLLSQRYRTAYARALVIARTEQLRAYRQATLESYRRSGVAEGWIWLATLDRRTCFTCVMMHGSEHPFDYGMNTHPACRCTMVPKVRNMPSAVRPGEDVFARWPASRQRRALGPLAYRAWEEGLISLRDLLTIRYNDAYGASVVKTPLRRLISSDDLRRLAQEERAR